MGLRALIADDDPAARRRLVALVGGRPGFDAVDACEDGQQAWERLRRERYDIVFLDVEMPERTGLEVAMALGPGAPAIVFVTAHRAHAVGAFEVGAVDYLVKPFDDARFEKTLERVLRRRPAGVPEVPGAKPTPSGIGGAEYLGRIAVEKRGCTRLVPLAAVESMHAEGNYVRVHTASESYLVRSSMKNLLARLDPRRFLRTQRSVIVNLEHVREIRRGEGTALVVTLRSGRSVPLSRRHQRRLPRLGR